MAAGLVYVVIDTTQTDGYKRQQSCLCFHTNKPHNVTNLCKITMRLLHSIDIQMPMWLLFFKATRPLVSF